MMRVFCKTISFNKRPLLWEIHRDKKSAVCLYQVRDDKGEEFIDVSEYQQEIDSLLRQLKGIEFQKKAIIVDFNLFSETYSFREIDSLSLSKDKDDKNRFFSASSTSSPSKLQVITTSSKKINAASFDKLMVKYAGSTICYNSLYRSSDKRLKQILKLEMITDTRLAILMDMYKDQLLYKLRSQQVDTLRQLFDQVLLPAIYQFFGDEKKSAIPEPLALYLQGAVAMALSNDSSNTQATSFEKQQEDNPFIKNEWYSKNAYAEREKRAEGKLTLLAFFCTDDMMANELVDENLACCLEGIRSEMTDIQRRDMMTLFQDIKQSILEVGILKHSNDMICSEAFVRVGPNCIPRVDIARLFQSINEVRSSQLFDSIFKGSSSHSDVMMDDTGSFPVYYSLLDIIKRTLNANKAKSPRESSQHAKTLFGSIIGKIYSHERTDFSNSEDDLTDKTINTTTPGIYLTERTYQELNKRLQAYRSPRINKQKYLNKFIIDTVLSIYQELRQGIESSCDDAAAPSMRM